MTQPTTVELPKPTMPMTNRVVADNPFPGPANGTQISRDPLLWMVGQTHPLVPELKIVRMYVLPGVGVEIYSAAADGKAGVRNTIPWPNVRLAEEIMDPETFIEEIQAAESNEPEEEEEQPAPPPEAAPFPGLVPMPPPATPNGTPS